MSMTMEKIGTVRSRFERPEQMRGRDNSDTEAVIAVEERFAEGIADIEPGDRLTVVFYFHLSKEAKLTVPLRGVGPMVGVFSSHSPTRPNFIGITDVTVKEINGLELTVRGADMLDGTPVLDMKPAI